ncbi:hypothetical protein KZC48_01755 [Microbacterium aurantiacum]|uniref:Uncharacterized protein n=1 Tax=Microbacterium aurantiacum TaxID=162393 RepID=A0ABT8FPJ8_9MICO|nr:hypothetical protein [Microbacterium aurantiacum]
MSKTREIRGLRAAVGAFGARSSRVLDAKVPGGGRPPETRDRRIAAIVAKLD